MLFHPSPPDPAGRRREAPRRRPRARRQSQRPAARFRPSGEREGRRSSASLLNGLGTRRNDRAGLKLLEAELAPLPLRLGLRLLRKREVKADLVHPVRRGSGSDDEPGIGFLLFERIGKLDARRGFEGRALLVPGRGNVLARSIVIARTHVHAASVVALEARIVGAEELKVFLLAELFDRGVVGLGGLRLLDAPGRQRLAVRVLGDTLLLFGRRLPRP